MLQQSEAARGAPGGCGASQRTLPGGGENAPRTYPRRGSGASGGRRPGHAERPEGQVLGGRGEPGGGPSAAPEPRAAAGGGGGGGTRRARVGASARAREWAPTGTRAALLGDPAGGRSPALASWKPRVGARPRGRPGLRARTETALPLIRPRWASGRCVCPARARAEGRRAGSRTSAARVAAPRRGRAFLLMCLPASAFFAPRLQERLGAAFPACEARKGCMSEQHDCPLASKLSFF
ncbi:translation initiation factor IF-2-like [Mustela erminea]|uniref:translation initiation factor IF-2-like n=1 Tax=Mustela erminea TaxID=36723 RepID=UPI0013870D86|nr:translation initiation factor IF-2-like [Mustela erminea]